MKSDYEQAIELAEESVKRFGFVVVWYEPEMVRIGEVTPFLWKTIKTENKWLAARAASPGEAQSQLELFRLMTGRKAPSHISWGVPVVMLTD